MEDIYETKSDFVFDNISLISPKNIQGGNYFIKFLVKDKPLYIQPPKCKTKNGIFKSAKKMYCDLMFTHENEEFIHWMEKLENYCTQMIFKNKDKWFETELDLHDIENSFTTPLKLYKSGKYYISRTNVPCILGKCSLKIYDEDEEEIHYETIKEDMNIMSILEIQGIKCSPRSFQIEMELKQMMVMKPTNLFEKCIFNNKSKNADTKEEVTSMIVYNDKMLSKESWKKEEKEKEKEEEEEEDHSSVDLGKEAIDKHLDKTDENPIVSSHLPTDNSYQTEEIMQPTVDCPESDILEIDFDLDKLNEEDIFTLKTKNDIYYKMYKDAREKAQLARNLAISSYLEAKNIKNKYKLDDIEESDSEFEKDLENNAF